MNAFISDSCNTVHEEPHHNFFHAELNCEKESLLSHRFSRVFPHPIILVITVRGSGASAEFLKETIETDGTRKFYHFYTIKFDERREKNNQRGMKTKNQNQRQESRRVMHRD